MMGFIVCIVSRKMKTQQEIEKMIECLDLKIKESTSKVDKCLSSGIYYELNNLVREESSYQAKKEVLLGILK